MKLLFSLIILSSFILFSAQAEEIPKPSCVVLTKAENQPAGAFTFLNTCEKRMYINACVADAKGETKLYKSFKAVPNGSNFTIYTSPTVTIDQIHWVAGEIDPGIPPLCLLHHPETAHSNFEELP